MYSNESDSAIKKLHMLSRARAGHTNDTQGFYVIAPGFSCEVQKEEVVSY